MPRNFKLKAEVEREGSERPQIGSSAGRTASATRAPQLGFFLRGSLPGTQAPPPGWSRSPMKLSGLLLGWLFSVVRMFLRVPCAECENPAVSRGKTVRLGDVVMPPRWGAAPSLWLYSSPPPDPPVVLCPDGASLLSLVPWERGNTRENQAPTPVLSLVVLQFLKRTLSTCCTSSSVVNHQSGGHRRPRRPSCVRVITRCAPSRLPPIRPSICFRDQITPDITRYCPLQPPVLLGGFFLQIFL